MGSSNGSNVSGNSQGSSANSLVSILSHLVSLPVFLVLHKALPNPDWPFHSDRILLFAGTVIVVESLFQALRGVVIIAFIGSLAWLAFGTFKGNYGFKNLYTDYRDMVYTMIHNPEIVELVLSHLKPITRDREIVKAIDYTNPQVRNFAIAATSKHFKEESHGKNRVLIQCLAMFKEINTRWNYVSDPRSREYFAKASESVNHLGGDCDDHSILMAACIKAIGGECRLVETKGHIYPELLAGAGSDIESVNFIIKNRLFCKEALNHKICYHTDKDDKIWLNLDYTEKYPGGPFKSKEILGILNL